jgi:hypothetical protein
MRGGASASSKLAPSPQAELQKLRGPLDDERLEWLTRLYGPVDAKYRSLDYVRRQFVRNPFGWSAHVFAVAEGEPVGHCGVVPFRARLGDEQITVGKLEALAVSPSHRGRREDGGSLATDILATLYPFAVAEGLPLLFGLAPPPVARIHLRAGCRQLPLEAPAYVLVADRRAFAGPKPSLQRRAVAASLAFGQRVLGETAYALTRLAVRSGGCRLRPPLDADRDLAVADAGEGRWTVSGADAWDWYVGSGVLGTLETEGRHGSRALLRLDEAAPTTVQLVAWRPSRSSTLAAILVLGAAARIARARKAPTLRFQPWQGSSDEQRLARACQLLGLVTRPEADLLVYAEDPALLEALPALTPFFYVTF